MKKVLYILICGLTLLTITGCSYSDVFNNKDTNNKDSNVTDNKNEPSTKPNEDKKGIEVTIGQNIQYDDNYNISFIESYFTHNVEPTNPDSYYTYFPASDGNTYLVLKTVIKNLDTELLAGEKLPKGKLIYDGKYKYDAITVMEEDDGSELSQYSFYMDIDPLTTKKIWYMVEVPQEIESNTNASLVMQYNFNSKTYNVKIR